MALSAFRHPQEPDILIYGEEDRQLQQFQVFQQELTTSLSQTYPQAVTVQVILMSQPVVV